MPKYIELEVPDYFDDELDTTYTAVDEANSISHASPVGRNELIGLLQRAAKELPSSALGVDIRAVLGRIEGN